MGDAIRAGVSRLRDVLSSVVLAATLVIAHQPASAATGDRVALIIGNDAYEHLPPLVNAANDAKALDERLRGLGFETHLLINAGKRALGRAVLEFGSQVTPGGVGLVFYAGHGIEAEGENYLVPVDARLEDDLDLQISAIPLGQVLQTLKDARARLNVLILDACRDNPLPKRGRSAARGLARVSPPSGTFVAYAAAPNQIAQDGEPGGNGVFTGELLKVIDQPGLKIEEVFKQVAAGVYRRTGGRQEPYTQASLKGDFYFKEATIAAAPTAPVPATPAPPTAAPAFDPRTIELAFWESIKDSDRAADFEAYLKRYQQGIFADLARLRVEALKGPQIASLPPGGGANTPSPAASAQGPAIVELDDSYVTVKTSNIRSEPTTEGEKLATLPADTLVQATGRLKDGSWVRIAHQGGSALGVGQACGACGRRGACGVAGGVGGGRGCG
jgi:hypothetical protein